MTSESVARGGTHIASNSQARCLAVGLLLVVSNWNAPLRADEGPLETSVRPSNRGPVQADLSRPAVEELSVDLLIVGGNESAVAAAVQAARLGVESIALVNDIDWLGGQFTAEGLGAVDEWTIYHGGRTYFTRSGLFLEIMDAIEANMQRKYGLPRPGNSWTAWTTCEPRDTERIFRRLLEPYLVENGGPVRLYENCEPVATIVEQPGRLRGVEFKIAGTDEQNVAHSPRIHARLTIDASDWGDVIRLSGAEYMAGPDLKSQFGESGAPETFDDVGRNEMNPITWCMILRETDRPTVIDPPADYDPRTYFGAVLETQDEFQAVGWPRGTMSPHSTVWVDSDVPEGPYGAGRSVYTHRRLVDRRHNHLVHGTECLLLNWPLQDYPLYNFPRPVVDALEATEPGASRKNIVDMTPVQRRIVFADARRHSLGLLHFLQTIVADRQPAGAVTFRDVTLTDEFGTPDRLPLKPYIREGLRLSALYVLREKDVRDTDGVQSWASAMPPDSVFGYQFNIDFHPTQRIFLEGNNNGPWAHIHSNYRNWGTHTDRAGFPLRSLIPRELDGLIGAGKNLGYSSIVSSAVRLHGHGVLVGQAAATCAATFLEQRDGNRTIQSHALDPAAVFRIQRLLVDPPIDPVTNRRPPGVLLWPYQDVPPDAPHFVAANMLAVLGVLPGDPGLQDFQPERIVTRREVARSLTRALLLPGVSQSLRNGRDNYTIVHPVIVNSVPIRIDTVLTAFRDVEVFDPDFSAIESLRVWHLLPAGDDSFQPDEPATFEFARDLLLRSFPDTASQINPDSTDELTKSEWALLLWNRLSTLEDVTAWLDSPGAEDADDPLPFDRDNDSLVDRIDPDDDGDGIPDVLGRVRFGPTRAFNFTGAGSAGVPGFTNDTGQVFSKERGFGWTEDITANHRRRGRNGDPSRDTFLFTRSTATWECAVENSRYRVTVCIGDSGFEQPGQSVTIEGVDVADEVATGVNQFVERAAIVTVRDGRLTVDIGSGVPGCNTCLNRLRIQKLD